MEQNSCQECGSFYQDEDDMDMGVCMNNEVFEPFAEEIVESGSFASCRELYQALRYHGEREACEQFEEVQEIEIPEGMNLATYLKLEQMKYENVDEITKLLYTVDNNILDKVISEISTYVYLGNQSAYEGLESFYLSLGPAESIWDVKTRLQIIGIIATKGMDVKLIKAYINELDRTPSNNTTRQLYTEILKRLSRYSSELVQEPLLELISKKTYGVKIKNRILDVAFAFPRE